MLRYGSVPYLNARPLLEGLEAETGPVRLEVPSRLVAALRDGEIDVALAPVVAQFESPRFVLVPTAAVAAHGAVESVLLFCRTSPAECRTVALDTSSRTSADLVRVLFRSRWGSSPTFHARDPDPDLLRHGPDDPDAVLLIGDPALRARWEGPPPVDLGAEWQNWTGLPFVFAAWMARDAAAAAEAEPVLRRAAERGAGRLDSLTRRGAADLGLPEDRIRRYLQESLRYAFGPEERRGLERFRELWSALPRG